jgi:LmbE family N-acetylglucosaminyl deacetylase
MHKLQTLWKQTFPQPIREGLIPRNLRLLVVGPHPDDFDSIGVTLRSLSEEGNPLHVAVIRTGSGVEDNYRPSLTLAEKTEVRDREQRDSARFFGLSEPMLTFMSLEKDTQDQLKESAANVHTLTEIIADKAPDIIFLPHGHDTNNGHRVTCAIVRQVVARQGRPVALFLNRDAKTIEMRTDLYMPFGEEMARWKAEMLRFHDTQQQRNLATRGHGFDERVLMLNAQIARDLKIDAPYAEAFELEFYNVAG